MSTQIRSGDGGGRNKSKKPNAVGDTNQNKKSEIKIEKEKTQNKVTNKLYFNFSLFNFPIFLLLSNSQLLNKFVLLKLLT